MPPHITTRPAAAPLNDHATFLAHAVDGQGHQVDRLRQAWQAREVVSPEVVAPLVGETGLSFGESWRTQMVVGALARNAGLPATAGALRLPEPAVKVSLDARQYDQIVSQQRGAAGPRRPDYTNDWIDGWLLGCGVLGCLIGTSSMMAGLPCSWYPLACAPLAGTCVAGAWCAGDLVRARRAAAPSAAGLIQGPALFEGAPGGARHVQHDLVQAGNLSLQPGTSCTYRLVSFVGVPEAVAAHIEPQWQARTVDYLRVVYAEGKRLEKLALAERLRSEFTTFSRPTSSQAHRDGGYQALSDIDEGSLADSFVEATNILTSKIAQVESEAEAYGNLLPFRDAPHAEDLVYWHEQAVQTQRAALQKELDQLRTHTVKRLGEAGKPVDFINRTLASHPRLQALELQLAELRAPATVETMQR